MLKSAIIFILGLAVLIVGAEAMVRGAVGFARRLGLSRIVIGLTIVAFGTSAPELVVSVMAAVKNSPDLSIGNVVGSNIANIGLIVGITAFLIPIPCERSILKFDVPAMFVSMAALILLSLDGLISRWDAIVLLTGLVMFLVFTYSTISKRDIREEDEGKKSRPVIVYIAGTVIGIVALTLGARLMVEGAVDIARIFGMSELVIGSTIVALGTSLPELATSMVAVYRKQSDIGLGNIIGSNIFNVCFILGIAPLIRPLAVHQDLNSFEYPIMVGFAVVLAAMMAKRRNMITRPEGAILFICFAVFLAWSFLFG